ncbi:MAG: hypothetical protein JWN44_439 [Myxococcales bacterium]|nr:hypothetical protein [Myxococcales bacterium]
MRLLIAACALAALTACTSTHLVRPLGRGNGMVHASLGGPLIKLGSAVFPTPIATVGGAYGVRDDVELYLHANITAAAFGDLHLEPGVAYHPIVRDRGPIPTVTVTGSLHFLTDFTTSARALPQLSAATAWALGKKRHLLYGGLDLAISFEGRGWVPIFGPFVGGELRVGKRVGLSLEAKYLVPNFDTAAAAPAWVAPGGFGYVSVLLGLNVYLAGAP